MLCYITVCSWWDVQISKDKLASYLATATEQGRGAGMIANENWPNSCKGTNKECTSAPRLFSSVPSDIQNEFCCWRLGKIWCAMLLCPWNKILFLQITGPKLIFFLIPYQKWCRRIEMNTHSNACSFISHLLLCTESPRPRHSPRKCHWLLFFLLTKTPHTVQALHQYISLFFRKPFYSLNVYFSSLMLFSCLLFILFCLFECCRITCLWSGFSSRLNWMLNCTDKRVTPLFFWKRLMITRALSGCQQ